MNDRYRRAAMAALVSVLASGCATVVETTGESRPGEERLWTPLRGVVIHLAVQEERCEQFTFRLPREKGLKLWLTVNGEDVSHLGLRSEWGDEKCLDEAVRITVRTEPLNGLAAAHANVRVVLISGRIVGKEHWDGSPKLQTTQERGMSSAVPSRDWAFQFTDPITLSGQPTCLGELQATNVPVRLMIQIVDATSPPS
jgi:hypothetical protein